MTEANDPVEIREVIEGGVMFIFGGAAALAGGVIALPEVKRILGETPPAPDPVGVVLALALIGLGGYGVVAGGIRASYGARSLITGQ